MSANVYLVIGRPNSGKDTVARQLATATGGVMISSGEVIRRGTDEVSRTAQSQQSSGGLVDSGYVEQLMSEALMQVPLTQAIVLSGVTRKPEEVDWLLGELKGLGRNLAGVLYLDISPATSQERYEARRATESRNDDDPAVQARRQHEFDHQTMRSIERYGELGLLHRIDAEPAVDAVIDACRAALGLPV